MQSDIRMGMDKPYTDTNYVLSEVVPVVWPKAIVALDARSPRVHLVRALESGFVDISRWRKVLLL
jgi:hypothetical protein